MPQDEFDLPIFPTRNFLYFLKRCKINRVAQSQSREIKRAEEGVDAAVVDGEEEVEN
jgi:hypothetical protein